MARKEPLMTDKDYIEERLEAQLRWYDDKSRENKITYLRLRKAEIIIAGLIPVFVGTLSLAGANTEDGGNANYYMMAERLFQMLAALGGVALVIINKILDLGEYYKLWKDYRNVSEALQAELLLYKTGSDPYDEDDAFEKFVTRAEMLMSAERQRWLASQQENKKKKKHSDKDSLDAYEGTLKNSDHD